MRQFLFPTVLILVLFSCKKEITPSPKKVLHPNLELSHKIDEYFTALLTLEKFNGVIYVTKNDSVILEKAYNLNIDQNTSTYVEISSQFDIHSVSKLMGYYLIEKLQLEGKLNKDMTIDRFFSGFSDGDKITIDMLLHHTSGLPRSLEKLSENEIDLTSDQIMAKAARQKLIFEPGKGKQYSNVGYQLVYMIIEQISGKSFSQYLNDELFTPLHMVNSGAHFYTKHKKLSNLAKNHTLKDSVITQVPNVLNDELKTARIFSTAQDLNLFLNHIKKEPYGSLLQKKNVIEKNGGSDGIRTQVYTHLKEDYNFILLANYDEIPFQKTIVDFINILEDKPYKVPKELNRIAIDVPVNILNRYTGTYTFADMNIELVFKIENQQLVVYQDNNLEAILNAESEDTFFDNPKAAESMEFVKNDKGNYDVLMGWKGIKLKGVKK